MDQEDKNLWWITFNSRWINLLLLVGCTFHTKFLLSWVFFLVILCSLQQRKKKQVVWTMLSCSLMDSMTCRQPKPDGVEATVELPMVSSLPTVVRSDWEKNRFFFLCWIVKEWFFFCKLLSVFFFQNNDFFFFFVCNYWFLYLTILIWVESWFYGFEWPLLSIIYGFWIHEYGSIWVPRLLFWTWFVIMFYQKQSWIWFWGRRASCSIWGGGGYVWTEPPEVLESGRKRKRVCSRRRKSRNDRVLLWRVYNAAVHLRLIQESLSFVLGGPLLPQKPSIYYTYIIYMHDICKINYTKKM